MGSVPFAGHLRQSATRKGPTVSSLDKKFTAPLQQSPNKARWTYVVMPRTALTLGGSLDTRG
jgi:hypothetical protein